MSKSHTVVFHSPKLKNNEIVIQNYEFMLKKHRNHPELITRTSQIPSAKLLKLSSRTLNATKTGCASSFEENLIATEGFVVRKLISNK
jgi:hypothetical protein